MRERVAVRADSRFLAFSVEDSLSHSGCSSVLHFVINVLSANNDAVPEELLD